MLEKKVKTVLPKKPKDPKSTRIPKLVGSTSDNQLIKEKHNSIRERVKTQQTQQTQPNAPQEQETPQFKTKFKSFRAETADSDGTTNKKKSKPTGTRLYEDFVKNKEEKAEKRRQIEELRFKDLMEKEKIEGIKKLRIKKPENSNKKLEIVKEKINLRTNRYKNVDPEEPKNFIDKTKIKKEFDNRS